jgi:hypothetical protein
VLVCSSSFMVMVMVPADRWGRSCKRLPRYNVNALRAVDGLRILRIQAKYDSLRKKAYHECDLVAVRLRFRDGCAIEQHKGYLA